MNIDYKHWRRDSASNFFSSFQVQTLCTDNTASVTIILPHLEVSKITEKRVEDLYSPIKEVTNIFSKMEEH